MLPVAIAAASDGASGFETSGLDPALGPYLRKDNLQAVTIFQRPDHRWRGDVVLREAPRYLHDVFGLPPVAAFQDAKRIAHRALVMALRTERKLGPDPFRVAPRFEFFGGWITLGFPEPLATEAELAAMGCGTPETATAQLDALVRRWLPGGCDEAAWNALPDETRQDLTDAMRRAMLNKVFKYPPAPVKEEQALVMPPWREPPTGGWLWRLRTRRWQRTNPGGKQRVIREGVKRLARVLPEVLDEGVPDDAGSIKLTMKSAETVPFMRVDNIAALLVYADPRGGWHSDLLFKVGPQGSNAFGTLSDFPVPTRAEAERLARDHVRSVIATERRERRAAIGGA